MRGMLKSLGRGAVVFGRKPVTIHYPDEKRRLPTRARTFPYLIWNHDLDEPNCTGCGKCAKACPVDCMTTTLKKNSAFADGRSNHKSRHRRLLHRLRPLHAFATSASRSAPSTPSPCSPSGRATSNPSSTAANSSWTWTISSLPPVPSPTCPSGSQRPCSSSPKRSAPAAPISPSNSRKRRATDAPTEVGAGTG